jgi:aryl-alcohol dehydrogenase-like predicted oxidoreductase
MEYRSLGRTGVKVSPLCLGHWMFGSISYRLGTPMKAITRTAISAKDNSFADQASAVQR